MNIETELRSALRRTEPPAGFTERVLAAIEHEGATARPRQRAWRPLAAALLLAAFLGGGAAVRYVEQQREGERAKQQVLLALHITSGKLRDARNHVHEISTR